MMPMYIFISVSQPLLNEVVISGADDTNLTTHTAVGNNLHKISVAAGAKDNAVTPLAFPDKEKI